MGYMWLRNGGQPPFFNGDRRYYTKSIPVSQKTTMSDRFKNVLRTDRLPTSDKLDGFKWDYNPSILQQNINFGIYIVPGQGVTYNSDRYGTGASIPTPNINGLPAGTNVLESFNCPGMVPLPCYTGFGDDFETIRPCNNPRGTGYNYVENGCYILLRNPQNLFGFEDDWKIWAEWGSRYRFMFALCRGVLSQTFTNNWINGSLFAFPFKNSRYFDSNNVPYSEYCTDTVFLDVKTSNFYYRSSPYNYGNLTFIGKTAPSGGGNKKNLLFPTTLMDLGPRSSYMQEISVSDNYDGYVLNRLKTTTFGDVSELLNYFLITRVTNYSVFEDIAKVNVLSFFSRKQNGSFIRMIDGDYAQMLSINSELGVLPFDETYPSDSVFYYGAKSPDSVFGVFYSSNTQTRDWISPRRTIIDGYIGLLSNCSFNKLPVKTQNVPFYQWSINENDKESTVFGQQTNDWYTDTVDGGSFFNHGYQTMDRLLTTSRYFRTNNITKTDYFKGYIYGVDNLGDLDSSEVYWEKNGGNNPRVITVGAPYYFYFGLKKGKSAFDRLTTKWVDTENIIE
jgi:hypothetical protein